NIVFTVHHILPKLTDTTAVNVGNEWYPYNTSQLLENSLPALIAFISGTLALGLSGRKIDARTALSFFTAILFGLMLFQARRFVEYFPAFALIFAAFAWAPLLAHPQTAPANGAILPLQVVRANLPAIVLAIFVVLTIYKSVPTAREQVDDSKPYHLYAGASAWLEQNTPVGALVFQTDWDDFPRLFFYNTHNTYLAGLDPTYMQSYDPELYDLWVDITRGDVEDPSQYIVSNFGSRYVHTDLYHGDFLDQAKQDPGLREVYRDNQAVIFEVIAP
ncbi:MAG: hypothetical protein U1B80_10260, partial [Anaerolineaceae bacterium]|nr:hypothetical protein [Anaerolineaceae bacterium]